MAIQDTTTSTPDVVLQSDGYSIKEWFKYTRNHRPKEINLNIITDPEDVKSIARLKKLLVILKRKPAQDNQITNSSPATETHNAKVPTESPSEEQTTIIDCNFILEEDCGPTGFGPRLSAKLLKILTR